jgi:TonB-linked SusC/RagA family outer membrane protein
MIKVYKKTWIVLSEAIRRLRPDGARPQKNLLTFAAVLCLLFAVGAVQAQNNTGRQTIKGKVVDQTNQPLVGVSVRIKNTSNGVSTDVQGNFQISAASTDVLQFSYIGFKSIERAVGSETALNITMTEDAESLKEVVVVGYSTKNATQLSSSVSVVSGDDLRDVTSNSLASLLQGKAPGVVVSSGSGDPTSQPNILIRGAGTISAGSGPLIVVDGNIGGSYNPSDVESVTILKDAAATGLYGSRAGNGVMIITTKTGKAGKPKIEFSTAIGTNKASTGNFQLMNTQQLYDYQTSFYTPDPAVLNTNTNWFNEAFRTGMTQNYTLSASGGSDKTQYYVSGNYYKEEGTIKNNDKGTYNFRTNLSHNLTSRLKVAVLFNGIYSKNNYDPAGLLYPAYTNMPFDPAYNTDGSPTDPRVMDTWYGRDNNNFLHNLQYDKADAKALDVSSDLNLDYAITKNLSIATYNRIKIDDDQSVSFYDKRSSSGATNGGELYNSSSNSSNIITSNRLKYDNSFGQHTFSGLAVLEATQSSYEVLSTAVKGLPPGRPYASTAIDILTNPRGGKNEYSFQKYLAQADYNFANKYFAVASFVRERSSRFGNDNPAANFYQLGASWILTNESFMEKVAPISFLKLRGSYGTTGNAEIGDYAATGLYSIDVAYSYANAPGAAPLQKGNPNLTWETQKTANAGLDIGLFKRVDLSVDVYQRIAEDLLYRKPLPATTGYSFVFENIGSVRNRGLEFNLTTKNLVNAFTWETNFNMAFNRNKVLELNDGALFSNPGARQPIGLGHDMDEWNMPVWAGVDPATGDPLWEKIITDADGKKFLTYTNSYNSVANAENRQYQGKSSAPKFTGGISNSFAYKGFTLSAFLNFVYGNYVYNDSRFYFDNDGVYEKYNQMVLADGWNRWEKPGDIATHPRAVLGGNNSSNSSSTRYLEDGSYIRLRNVTFGYDLPKSILGKLRVANARIFVSGDNLWTLTRFSGVDPEVVLSSGESSFRYPISKKILAGLNVSF